MAATDDVLFPSPQTIAAGFFHSVVSGTVVSTGPLDALDDLALQATSQAEGEKCEMAMYAFGDNKNCALGVDKDAAQSQLYVNLNKSSNTQIIPEPVAVTGFDRRHVSQVSCGGNHTAFLEKHAGNMGGQVWTCGLGTCGRLGVKRPTTWDECSKLMGAVWNRGGVSRSRQKEIADELINAHFHSKWKIAAPVPVAFPTKDRIGFVSCGNDHTLAVTMTGALYAWGLGSFGNLGNGSTEDCEVPQFVHMPADVRCCMAAAGTKHSMALTTAGSIYTWGHGGNGRLGLGVKCDAALLPTEVVTTSTVPMRWVAAGEAHSASVDAVGHAFCWGAGTYGRTGHGEDMDEPVPRMMQSLGAIPCTRMELGTVHSLALSVKGVVYGWGTGPATGVLVAGSVDAQHVPKAVRFGGAPNGIGPLDQPRRVVQIAAGCFHSLALQEGGVVFAWGIGGQGRLGLGCSAQDKSSYDLADQFLPRPIGTLRGWCASGDGGDDRVGDGDATKITALAAADTWAETKDPALAVHCGGMHSAYVSGGEVWTWGCGEYGQTGLGTSHDMAIPALVPLLDARMKVVSLALGLEHCFAITATSELLAWGRNHCGQLGFGTTKDCSSPQRVHGLFDVVSASAGEDHSACVVTSGNVFTWGASDCGKLGHGSGMHGGCVQVARQVGFDKHAASVDCGASHTAVIDVRGRLYTFGAGWFGRLGHEDIANVYSPTLVERFATSSGSLAAPRVIDVRCASYHTCVVSEDAQLFHCGRDRLVCAVDHLASFTLFDVMREADGEPVKVRAVAPAEHHTLLLSQRGTIFTWGDNKSGQLGIDPDICPRIGIHVVAHKAWSERRRRKSQGKSATVVGISAGPTHSLALLGSGHVYAWGLQSGGRLGIGRKGANKEIFVPELVPGQWFKARLADAAQDKDQNMGGTEAADERSSLFGVEDRKKADEGAQPRHTHAGDEFGSLQRSLRSEAPEQTVEELRRKEKKLNEMYIGYMSEIFGLWDKPPVDGAICEWTLRELRTRLDKSVCRNLRYMKVGDEYPTLESLRINPDIARSLVHYEEMVWYLQQQPCYIARLAEQLRPGEQLHLKGFPGKVADVFLPADFLCRVTKCIFRDLEDSRTRNLFMALLRRMIKSEVHRYKKLAIESADVMLGPRRSWVYNLVSMAVLHPYFKDFHRKLFNPDEQGSLVSIVEEWTSRRAKEHVVGDGCDEGNTAANKQGGKSTLADGLSDALFAMHESELLPFEQMSKLGHRDHDIASEREHAEHLRARLQEHFRVFQQFLGARKEGADGSEVHGITDGKGVDSTPSASEPHWADTFTRFMDRFKPPKNMKSIWKVVRRAAELHSEHFGESTASGSQRRSSTENLFGDPKVYDPISRLFLGAILGQVLEHHEELMSSVDKQALRKRCLDKLKSFGFEEDDVRNRRIGHFAKKVDLAIKKVHFNLTQLGKFFKRVAVNDFTAAQEQLRIFGKDVKENCIHGFIRRLMEDVEDDTETRLTIDVYASHYDMKEHHVMLSTPDLLHLSNALWVFQADVIPVKEDHLHEDHLHEDNLYKALDQLQPQVEESVQKVKRLESSDNRLELMKRCWPPSVIGEAEHNALIHNFSIFHRFLELHRDLTFCIDCQAPIPRALALPHQRKASATKLLRVYKPVWEPCLDNYYPFRELHALFSNPELPFIKSKEFLFAKIEFEEVQKAASESLHQTPHEKRSVDDFALIAQIEKGKRMLDILKREVAGPMVAEHRFIEYVHEALNQRRMHRRYLDSVEKGIDEIRNAQHNYKNDLEKTILALRKAVDMSENVMLPTSIRNKAGEHGERLKFQQAEKAKRNDESHKRELYTSDTKLLPSATYGVLWLRYKGVIARMGSGEGRLPASEYKRVTFTFNGLESGNWSIIVVHTDNFGMKHMMFEFEVSVHELERMKRAGKSAKKQYNDGFVTINCFNLLQLLARISAL